jgi:CBS domain-containing protein
VDQKLSKSNIYYMMSQSKTSVREIMRDVHTISADVSFKEALREMICKKTNSLVVVNEEGVFEGLVNARVFIEYAIPPYISNDEIAAHYANEELFREAVNQVADKPLRELIEKDIETIGADESLMKAAVIATKNRQIRIPVLDEEKKPIGLLTRTELKQLIGTFLEIDRCFDLE